MRRTLRAPALLFLFAVVVWSSTGGVNMFDSTFLLGPLHFLQEERISIQIFGKGQ